MNERSISSPDFCLLVLSAAPRELFHCGGQETRRNPKLPEAGCACLAHLPAPGQRRGVWLWGQTIWAQIPGLLIISCVTFISY